ncbi:hypothetical protein V8F20_010867 [Naviculisporaceae sp. PSN 640]
MRRKVIDTPSKENPNQRIVDSIVATSHETQHPSAQALAALIQEDGAGSWPPKTNHVISSWPSALQPYRQIWDDLSPLVPTLNNSQLLDDQANRRRIEHFRCLMRENLAVRVNIEQVKEILTAESSGELGKDIFNALYCCIASLRHAYRWAIIPAVKVAQGETRLDIPPELTVPWSILQSRYGLRSESSNLTGNFLLNFTPTGEYVLKINSGMPDHIQECEELFARIPFDLEALALPIYKEIIQTIIAFDRSDKPSVLRHVENINVRFRDALRVFYDNMHDSRLPRSIWMSHVQGFQAWGLERADGHTGETIEDDGLSGSHILLFQALDSFLGIERYLSDDDWVKFVPARQRKFCETIRKYSPRGRLSSGHAMIEEGFSKIAERFRIFRAAHKTRVMPYLSVPAPERLPMTAGKSVLKGASLNDALEPLHALLITRLAQTA